MWYLVTGSRQGRCVSDQGKGKHSSQKQEQKRGKATDEYSCQKSTEGKSHKGGSGRDEEKKMSMCIASTMIPGKSA